MLRALWWILPNTILNYVYGEERVREEKISTQILKVVLEIVSFFWLITLLWVPLFLGEGWVSVTITACIIFSFPITTVIWALIVRKKYNLKNKVFDLSMFFTVVIAIFLVISLIICAVFGGFSKTKLETTNDEALNGTIVTKIGNVEISQAYYNFIYSLLYSQMAQYEQYYGPDWINMEVEDGKTIGDFIKENTENQLSQFAAAAIIAEEYGIKVNGDVKKAVETQKKDIIKSYEGEENFKKFLEDSHTTDKAVTTYLEMNELLSRMYKKITKKGEPAYIADKDLEKDFLEDYKNMLRVQHILVSTQEQTDEQTGETKPARSDEDAQKLVAEIIAKLDKGEDFDALITEYDEDPGMEAGKFYVFGEGEMVPEFEQASKDLKVGEYTKEGVKTDYGYHIIKKYEINTDIEEFDTYKESKQQEKITEVLEKKVKKLKVKWDNKTIDAYLKKWDDERKAAAEKAAEDAQNAQDPGVESPSPDDITAVEGEKKAE